MTTIRGSVWLTTALVTLAIAAFDVWGLRHEADVQVATAAVSAGSIVRRIVATGTLQAVTTVEVGAQVSGTIAFLAADFNAVVRKGQVLAKLDPSLFDAQLSEAEATLGQARASMAGFEVAVEDAQTKLTRAEQLANRQLIPQSDLDAARVAMGQANADLAAASSQVAQAEGAVNQAKGDLQHTIISSPIDGIVIARNVDVGQTVAAAFQAPVLFDVAADLKHMQLEVDIDEADIAGVQPGEPATFQVESYPEETFAGTVSTVRLQPVALQTSAATTGGGSQAGAAPTIAGTVVSYATMIDVQNLDEKLRPGMTATVMLAGSRRDDVVRIPNGALSFRPPPEVLDAVGQSADVPPSLQAASADGARMRIVWQYGDRRFTPVSVRTGLTDDRWTELAGDGLGPGDALVTSASVANGAGSYPGRRNARSSPE